MSFGYSPPGYSRHATDGVIAWLSYYGWSFSSLYVKTRLVFIGTFAFAFTEASQFIGITASDFFCPNLDTIAKFFGLSENITGVTFLAFGNGSPDVFATYSAMRNNSGSLAVGELLGAASFIVSVVVGSMCIIKPFHVRKGPFLRDVGFFAAAVALLLFILYDGKIEVWEAAALVGLYGLYVVAVVAVTWWGNRRRAQRDHEDLVRREYADDTTSTPISYTQDERYQDERKHRFFALGTRSYIGLSLFCSHWQRNHSLAILLAPWRRGLVLNRSPLYHT